MNSFKFLEYVVEEEDYATGLRQQKALLTGNMPHVMFGRNEGGGQRFHGWVDRLLNTDDQALPSLFRNGKGLTGRCRDLPCGGRPKPGRGAMRLPPQSCCRRTTVRDGASLRHRCCLRPCSPVAHNPTKGRTRKRPSHRKPRGSKPRQSARTRTATPTSATCTFTPSIRLTLSSWVREGPPTTPTGTRRAKHLPIPRDSSCNSRGRSTSRR